MYILAIQEIKYLDKNPMESNDFRNYKGNAQKKNFNIMILDTVFVVKKNITGSINFTNK